ncbi:MAG: isoaspartyl peptidase/L-asparaginase family protein [Thermoanaerobaculia bacterium]
MKNAVLFGCLLTVGFAPISASDTRASASSGIALVIHGGAGSLTPDRLSEEDEAEVRSILAGALETGYAVLWGGGSAVDAVEQTIRVLEDSPRFNAGKGAVFTAAGKNELDASIMNGAAMEAGAVASVTTVKNPITAARAVMEKTEHVLLAGVGAEAFAESMGLELVEPEYFFTERRWKALERRRQREKEKVDGEQSATRTGAGGDSFGTVGAVALDSAGRLAAGTSTGGMTYKQHGRVGDSPIVGAGTYASRNCGVSATGHGEYFIRHAVAFDICARMRYLNLSVLEAATSVVNGTLMETGGAGGIIAMDGEGNRALVFNTSAMYRGWTGPDGEPHTAIFRE